MAQLSEWLASFKTMFKTKFKSQSMSNLETR